MSTSSDNEWGESRFFEFDHFRAAYGLQLLLLGAFCLLFLIVFYQPREEQMEGEIFDNTDNAMVPDAMVVLHNYRGAAMDSMLSNNTGHFHFIVHHRQTYTLTVRKGGYTLCTIQRYEQNQSAHNNKVLRIPINRVVNH